LGIFEKLDFVDEIVVLLPADWRDVIEGEAIAPFGFRKVKCANGGASRTESTRNGLAASAGDIVLIHDGVRPLTAPDVVRQVAEAAMATGAALAAAAVRDTLKLAADDNGALVGRTVDRRNMWQAQTPQGFQRKILAAALADSSAEATDDVGLVEKMGLPVAIVPSGHHNLKITTQDDLMTAEALMNKSIEPQVRVGQGYDVHRLAEGRKLFLACVEVPHDKGLLGHSDADVMAHALADALLGAAALGDIGQHFSDKDPQWAGASGALILAESMAKIRARGFELINADLTLIGERPKIGPYREAMQKAVAAALSVEAVAINIKATTTEGLGFTGTGEGLAAMATAAIKK
jgi:2-C-methyl-D-erythritol 4-phosphate cytidylyltransferase/2-C-methyl-D-erythritol 2,4-cyclodiphosphate synthase